MNDERFIANDFMTNHKIVYKYDGSTKKGCFERCAKYAVWCVRSKFAPEYIYKEHKDKNDSSGKRRRNLQSLNFDPLINLRKNNIKKGKQIGTVTLSQNEEEVEGVPVQVSPSPAKKRLSEGEMKYHVMEECVQTLRSFFLACPEGCITTVDEFKGVRDITFIFFHCINSNFFFRLLALKSVRIGKIYWVSVIMTSHKRMNQFHLILLITTVHNQVKKVQPIFQNATIQNQLMMTKFHYLI